MRHRYAGLCRPSGQAAGRTAPGWPNDGAPTPSQYFFAPLEPLLVDGAPEHANSGRIARSSLVPIWEWICRDLLPIMARDYNDQMKTLIAANKPRDAQQAAATFQTKVTKSLEGNLASPEGAERARGRLAAYTASPIGLWRPGQDDGARCARAKRWRNSARRCRRRSRNSTTRRSARSPRCSNAFRKKDPDAVPFALALVAGRLKTPPGADPACHQSRAQPERRRRRRHALCDRRLDGAGPDRRQARRLAHCAEEKPRHRRARHPGRHRQDRIRARASIRELEASEWGTRLRDIRGAIVELVEAEVSRFPEEIGHVLKLHDPRGNGFLTDLIGKGRDAISDSAIFCKRLIGQT